MAPLSEDDDNDGPAVPPTALQTRSSKRGKPEVSEPEVSDAPPAKKPKKPGPKPKKRSGPKKSQDSSDDTDVLSDLEPQPKKPKQPKRASNLKGKAVEYDEDGIEIKAVVEIVFMIPGASTEGNQRVVLPSSHSFKDALEIMYETIGYVSVARKPTLAYKLSSAKEKAPTVNLSTDKDWSGLITDYSQKILSKKDLSVTIAVFPDNHEKKAPAVKKGTKKGGKMTTIDLDNDDTDGDGDDGVEDAEKKAMAELDAEHRTCVKCSTAHLCKIDRAGNHVHLTFPQRRAWAVSLACGAHKVTKSTPPQGGLFQMFHNNNSFNGPPAAAPTAYLPPPWYQLPPGHPGGYGMTGYPAVGYAQPPPLPPVAARQPMMSSDPIEEDAILYPSVIAFIESLITKAPKRVGLRAVGYTLDSLHFFEINELIALTAQELGTEKFGNVMLGDAQYLLKQAASEVQRLEKQAKRTRH
ncbi:hypothetical protein B0H13DRAFT_2316706 [Mycena leptocephala]|nr:hypothetical protein B0H13DRAFT_2316706 [Mycena leptocephala]